MLYKGSDREEREVLWDDLFLRVGGWKKHFPLSSLLLLLLLPRLVVQLHAGHLHRGHVFGSSVLWKLQQGFRDASGSGTRLELSLIISFFGSVNCAGGDGLDVSKGVMPLRRIQFLFL